MANTHVVSKRLFISGEWVEAGTKIDASSFASLRALVSNGSLMALESGAKSSAPVSSKKTLKNTEEQMNEDWTDRGGTEHATHYSMDELMNMVKADLIDLAVENGVAHSGTKADIAARLV